MAEMNTEVGYTGTGPISMVKTGAYGVSFGPMPDKTLYHEGSLAAGKNALNNDYMTGPFKSLRDALAKGLQYQQKALGTSTTLGGGAGTAGSAMIPVYVDPMIVDRSRKYTPLVEMFPRRANQGITADFNVITSKDSAITAAEDAALSEQDTTRDRSSTPIKFVYSVGRVTGPGIAAIPSYMHMGFQPSGSGLEGSTFANTAGGNALQQEVLARSRALKEKEEDLIVNGDTSTTSTEYNGIVQTQSTTNRTNLSGAAVTYGDMEDSVSDAYVDSGRPNLGVSSIKLLTDIRKIIIDTFHYRPADMVTRLPFGVQSNITYESPIGPIPILASQRLSNTSGSKSLYWLDMDVWEMRVLQDMTYEKLAKTNDSEKFMLKVYESLICRATAFNSWIANAK